MFKIVRRSVLSVMHVVFFRLLKGWPLSMIAVGIVATQVIVVSWAHAAVRLRDMVRVLAIEVLVVFDRYVVGNRYVVCQVLVVLDRYVVGDR